MESDKNYILMMFNWKIIGIVLLYTIVMISWLPIIIYAAMMTIFLVSIGILAIKDYISNQINKRHCFNHSIPITYKTVEKNTIHENSDEEIDWDGFDINNYKAENYRKIYYDHKREEIGNSRFSHLYYYPIGDYYLIFVFCGMLVLSFAEWRMGEYVYMRGAGLTAVLHLILYIYIPVWGRRYYIEDCKEEYRYNYLHG